MVALLLLAAVVGLAALGIFFFTKTGPFSDNSKPNNTSSTPQSNEDLGVKPPTDGDPTSNSVKTNPKPATSSDTTIEITSTHVNGDRLTVRTLISKLTDEGTCSLEVRNGTKLYTLSAGVQAIASASTCKGFDIPLAALGTGTWNISITYSNGSSSVTANKDVNVSGT